MFSTIDIVLAFLTGLNTFGAVTHFGEGRTKAGMFCVLAVIMGVLTLIGGALV